MKIAVIDMGTNTFHLLIASVENGHFTVLTRDRQPVKIGQEGLKDGWITTQAQERALKALITFKSKADESGVDKIYATGTSAIRNTENGLSLVKMIKDTTGIDVKIISGQCKKGRTHGQRHLFDHGYRGRQYRIYHCQRRGSHVDGEL